ncbi:MAG: hypothetical protein J1E56_02205 [Ruminococcus sp.]|nr:hypothetical protein [Ruminococcus sp.]
MEDMIKKVVEMDEKARELEAQTQQEKINIKEEIEAQRQKVYNDYIEKARIRAKKNDELARQKADENLAKATEKHKEMMLKLKEQFDSNCDKWVQELFERVTE